MDSKIELYSIEFQVYQCNFEYYSRHYYKKILDLTLEEALTIKDNLLDDGEMHFEFVNIIKQ